jgi:hypothetical protein
MKMEKIIVFGKHHSGGRVMNCGESAVQLIPPAQAEIDNIEDGQMVLMLYRKHGRENFLVVDTPAIKYIFPKQAKKDDELEKLKICNTEIATIEITAIRFNQLIDEIKKIKEGLK